MVSRAELRHAARGWTSARALLAVAVLLGLGWWSRQAALDRAPAPAAGTLAVTGDGDRGSPERPLRVEPRHLPGTVACIVDDGHVSGPDCARWSWRAPGERPFTRVVFDGVLAVAAAGAGLSGIDLATGEQRWHWTAPAGSDRDAPNGLVAGHERVVLLHEADARITALDARDGEPVWSTALDEADTAWIALAPPSGGVPALLVVREPTTLSVWRLSDGVLRFRRTLHAPGSGTPVVAGGLVLVPSGGRLVAVDLADGTLRWSSPVALGAVGRHDAPAVVAAGGALVAMSEDGELVGIDPAGGQVRWRTDVPALDGLLSLGDQIAAVTDLSIRVLDAATGAQARLVPTGYVDSVVPAGPRAVLLGIGQTLQRIDVDLAGETWTLQRAHQARAGDTVFTDGPHGPIVLSPLGGGRYLGAFAMAAPLDESALDALTCAGTRQSEALGHLRAWQGQHAHVALQGHGERTLELLVGLYHEWPLTVTARRLDGPGVAEFRAWQGDWARELTIDEPGRASAGWPPHWSLEARFSSDGCWQLDVRAPGLRDRVVVPVHHRAPPS